MKIKTELILKDVHRKISSKGNLYYEFSLIELKDFDGNDGKPYQMLWEKIFYQPESIGEQPAWFIDKKIDAVLNFYTHKRKVGDKTYTDIKMLIESFSESKNIG